jgi:RNase P subunit RPR2
LAVVDSSHRDYIPAMSNWKDGGRVEHTQLPRLTCTQCHLVARADTTGWRAYLTWEDELTTYCPECGEREFGGESD